MHSKKKNQKNQTVLPESLYSKKMQIRMRSLNYPTTIVATETVHLTIPILVG